MLPHGLLQLVRVPCRGTEEEALVVVWVRAVQAEVRSKKTEAWAAQPLKVQAAEELTEAGRERV